MATSEHSEFEIFLLEHRTKLIEKQSLFSRKTYSLFIPIVDQSKSVGIYYPELGTLPIPSLMESTQEAVKRFGNLPRGYSTFISTLGPGNWADAKLRHPHYLRPMGQPSMVSDFVTVADSVDGQGGCVAFNPQDGSANQQLYFICFGPTEYAVLGLTFEDWIIKLAELWNRDPENGPASAYDLELTELTEHMSN